MHCIVRPCIAMQEMALHCKALVWCMQEKCIQALLPLSAKSLPSSLQFISLFFFAILVAFLVCTFCIFCNFFAIHSTFLVQEKCTEALLPVSAKSLRPSLLQFISLELFCRVTPSSSSQVPLTLGLPAWVKMLNLSVVRPSM